MSKRKRELTKITEHPQYSQMKAELVKQERSIADIARDYQVSYKTLANHWDTKIKPLAAARRRWHQAKTGDSVLRRIEKLAQQAQDMVDSCADYLADPEDPTRFIVAPTAPEIQVIYYEYDPETGQRNRRRASLQELLDEVRHSPRYSETMEVDKLHSSSPDPRKLMLEAIERTEKVMTLMAKIEGSIEQGNKTFNITMMPEWQKIQSVILEATEAYPEARERIRHQLRNVSKQANE